MRKQWFVFLLAVTFTFLTVSTVAAGSVYNEGLYFKDKIHVSQAAKLLKGKKLKTTYIVVLDGGIDKAYWDKWNGKLIKDIIYKSSMGNYFGNGFSAYFSENPHGTNVQWISDEITYGLGVNDNKSKNPIQTIQYKITDIKGESKAEYFIDALNDIIDNYVVKKKWNIAVVNFSSGIVFGDPKSNQVIQLKKKMQGAIDNAIAHGVSVVTASGNDNKSIFQYPSLNNNVIVVGATDINNNRPIWDKNGRSGSNYGTQLDLVAPATAIQVYNLDGKWYNGSGTSYAAPQVTTAVAVLKAVNPKLTPNKIEEILKVTAQDLGKQDKNGWNKESGYGLLNLENAVKKAITIK